MNSGNPLAGQLARSGRDDSGASRALARSTREAPGGLTEKPGAQGGLADAASRETAGGDTSSGSGAARGALADAALHETPSEDSSWGSGVAQGGLTDAALCESVAERISHPKVAPADSFVLHAPLEILARTALLPLVEPAARERARRRISWLGTTYAAAGDESGEPPSLTFDRPADAIARLVRAIDAGELDDVDAAAHWLASALVPEDLCTALADSVVPRLSAAAHGSIFLYQLPRVAPRSDATARTLRGLACELARQPDWKLTWQLRRVPGGQGASGRDAAHSGGADCDAAASELFERLRRPASPGDPGSSFIFPIMSLVEQSGLAAELLDVPTRSLDIAAANQVLSRIAALSMLQDDPDHAPYGWTHCLSMPQAVLGIAESCSNALEAIAVAATYVLGFRATLGKVAIDPAWQPDRPSHDGRDSLTALAASPAEAAACMWHAPPDALPGLVAALATRAAIHEDAHLAKYTVACLDAARADPEAKRLYLAAAAYLSAWWAKQPDADRSLAI